MRESLKVCCCIAGGGPAGLMLGYLLARAGVDVLVLEKHLDFLRDFRGDTIHPSTLTVLHDLGLLDAFLALPHQEVPELTADVYGECITIADFTHLDAPHPALVLIPQWDFLDFIARQARELPNFTLRMGAKATGLIERDARVVGVQVETASGILEVQADLVVAADGRHSTLRPSAGLASQDLGAPIDVLWFRLPRDAATDDAQTGGHVRSGAFLVTLNRDSYWQCAYVIPKGGFDALREAGLEAFRHKVRAVVPHLAAAVATLPSWDEVKLLTVQVSRMPRWHREGLLCIGDAAHAMSPVGGVGINLAIQDAVAASNLLAAPLRERRLVEADLAALQRRREWPARVTQRAQIVVQNRLLAPVLAGAPPGDGLPWPLKLLQRFPRLRRIPARLVGIGVRPERVRTRPA
ncbi:MAG TPA: FAD-dependent oxidoreductase [Burkholderiaceae bacterium]|nr:FAD-dependent oxidoreductase [Burkholderiaceae bacterium]